MWADLIVEVDEDRQGLEALGVGAIGTGVGPFAQERANEPFGLAVGLGSIGPGSAVATLTEDRPIGV